MALISSQLRKMRAASFMSDSIFTVSRTFSDARNKICPSATISGVKLL
jgi:hypothetical protein